MASPGSSMATQRGRWRGPGYAPVRAVAAAVVTPRLPIDLLRSGPGRRGVALLDVLGVLLGGVAHLLGVLLAAVLDRLLRALGGVLRDLLAVLERLLAGLLRLLLDVVRHGADLLVLDARARDEQARDEPDRHGADGEAERVGLRDPDCPLRLIFHLLGVRRGVADRPAGAAHAVAHGAAGAADPVADRLARSDELVLHVLACSHDALLRRVLLLLDRFLGA